MAKDENSYKKILKGTSLLGGVQVFQIFINLVRGKFVAMFLGPEGMGFSSMYNSAQNTVSRFASLGLNLAFVKEVAAAKDDESKLATVRRIAELMIQATALLGAFACVLLSPWLSNISFGSSDYAWQFVLLGLVVYFNVSSLGYSAILQGLHKVKTLSVTSLAGAVCGLVVGVPLYYFFGIKGIVPAMIVFMLTAFCFNYYGVARHAPRSRVRFDRQLHMPLVKRLLAMGMMLLAANLINTAATYFINIFIRTEGNIADVGLFNAANSITLQYAGVVFTAMALDYFPRLSAVAADNARMGTIVNKQMEIVALIATPLTILLVATAPIVIRLLLTVQFLSVTPLMRWLGISILLKALAYPLGYIAFAKGNKRLFFWLEGVACNILYLGCSLIFYHFFGLIGLGYGAVVEQGLCVILYLIVNYKAYGYHLNRRSAVETLVALLLGSGAFCASLAADGWWGYYLLGCVLVISGVRSFIVLKGRMKRE